MKKLCFLALTTVGLLTVACSSKDVVDDVNNGTLDGKGKGYLNVSVNLPVQNSPSTRGWMETEQLDDGIAKEYAVDNVMLAVFGGADEATATLQQVVSKTTNWNDNGDDPNQITKTSDNIVFKLNEDVSGKLWVLAMLNYTDVVTADAANGTIKVGSTNVSTITDLQRAISETTDNTTKFRNTNGNFFMTNAVLSDLESGNNGLNSAGHAKILAEVTRVYTSETEASAANAAPSAEVFVERGLAKVTVEAGASNAIPVDNGVKDNDGKAITATLNGWVLDNTNMKSYIVRNTFTDSKWGLFSEYASSENNDRFRFVGVNPVLKEASTKLYRSYWAFDPNYDKSASGELYEPVEKTFVTGAAMSDPQYCFENTFDVKNQTYRNTTRVVLAVQMNGGNDFYTLNDDRKMLYNQTGLNAEAARALMLNSTFVDWFTKNGNGATLNGENVTVEWNADKAGIVTVASFKFKLSNNTTDETTYAEPDVISAINTALGKINRYVGGISYYAIRIKHFGDDLTPWGGHGEEESTIPQIYPGTDAEQEARYLGRYGVLRNNWYLLSLSAINKIGYPIVPWLESKPDTPDPNPEDPDHPDDSLDDSYLAAKIHILSWAKRPQGVILK